MVIGTILVLMLIAMNLAYLNKTRLKINLFQSIVLGLTMSIPVLYMILLEVTTILLSLIGGWIFKIATLLGGYEMKEYMTLIVIDRIKSGNFEDLTIVGDRYDKNGTNDVPSDDSENEGEVEGDR